MPVKRKAAPAAKRGRPKAAPPAAAPPDPNQMTLGVTTADIMPPKKKASASGKGALGKRNPQPDAADYS